MWAFLVLVLLVVVGVAAYFALRSAQDFSDANEVIPGEPTKAPKAWAGAHSAEARLHRRLRDAMEPLRVNASLDDPSMADVRHALEREALALDDTLVVVAALPKERREAPMRQITEAVEALEAAVADVVMMRGPAATGTTGRIEEVHTRIALVAAAREELAALDPTTTSLEELRRGLEADTASDPAPDPEEQPPS